MVHRVNDDQWRQLKAFSDVYGKRSLQFRLMELLRTMKVYDPQAEKEAFAENDLYSLRRSARKWLIRTGRRLAFAVKEVEEQFGDVEMLISWGHMEDAWDFVTEAKELATNQEEFIVLAGLLDQERFIAAQLFEGDGLTHELQRINQEAQNNLHNQSLVLAMSQHYTNHLEAVKNKLHAEGILDHKAIAAYFASDVHKSTVDQMPISVQIKKLSMDEFFYNITGQYEAAIAKANATVRLLKAYLHILEKEPDKLSKVLFNLVAFHLELNQLEESMHVIAQFEEESPTSERNRSTFLLRYLYVLFGVAMDFSIPEMAQKALAIWSEQSPYIYSLPHNRLRSETMLYASWYYLAQGDIDHARSLHAMINIAPMEMPRLLYRSMMALLHLILLFEDKDEIGLESIGRQYRRKLRAQQVAVDSPTMAVIAFLRNKTNLEDQAARQKALKRLADELSRCQSHPDSQRSLWYNPMLAWINHQLQLQ